jgi:hypothetical protein
MAGLLAGTCYDPGTAVSAATTSALAMTALDTTNLRLTFTAPASGNVWVRLHGTLHGATTGPQILLGVLSGATVMGRQSPMGGRTPEAAATAHLGVQAGFPVLGLTPAQSYSFDAAYGVESVVASTGLKYGGPNDTTTNNNFGGFCFEVWDTPNLLGGKMYDPSSAVQKATSSLLAMTALDTTNLRITFTAPTSGNVLVTMQGTVEGATTTPSINFGVLETATVRARTIPIGGPRDLGGTQATSHCPYRGEAVVTGLVAGNSYTWDAAYGVDRVIASTNLNYGGPDNTVADDAWGGFSYCIWAV